MSIEPGKTLLHYEIVEKLGAGGMGEVWLARDTALDREVAIKVLPDVFSADAERLARFEREAKLLAALEHPNVATVFGLHRDGADGKTVHFLAMEYVRGQDLSLRLTRGRPIVEEALGVALQIAEALAAAHARGIVHRDLKPANILLTPDAKVKVLDFGLAKAFEADTTATTHPSMSPTLTSAGTVAGVILGTAGYMSPEQARGHAVDKRADVWAFGCVLFELLSARQAFHGHTVSDTLASLLKLEPDYTRLPPETPRGVLRLIKRCLQKEARQRLHDIADARIEIEEALATIDEPGTAIDETPRSARRGIRGWVAAALALVALAGGTAAGWMLKPDRVEPTVRRYVLPSPDGATEVDRPVISPDGRRIAFVFKDKLYIRDLARFRSRVVEDSTGASAPFWSPDGKTIAFHAEGKLYKQTLHGGQRTAVCDLETLDAGAWGNDGTMVLNKGRNLYEVSARGGELQLLDEGKTLLDYHGLELLPGGKGLLLLAHNGDGSNTLELWSGDDRKTLMTFEDIVGDPRYAAPGYILYTRRLANAGIWAVPFSLAASELSGEPFLIAADSDRPSVARDGTLIYLGGGNRSDLQLVSVGLDDGVVQTIGQPLAGMWMPVQSPDGSRTVVNGHEQGSDYNMWLIDATRDTQTRLTSTKGAEAATFWFADGKRILFFHPVFGEDSTIYTMPADGGDEPTVVTEGESPTASANGELMVFVRKNENADRDLWWMPLDGTGEPDVFLATDALEYQPRLSPDGSLLAYVSDDSGQEQIYLVPFPSGRGRLQISNNGGSWPTWSPDGDRLYFLGERNDAQLLQVEVDTTSGLKLSSVSVAFEAEEQRLSLGRGFAVVPGNKLVTPQRVAQDETGKEASPQGIYVVENWLVDFAE